MSARPPEYARAAWLAVVLLLVTLPHALEDFAFGEPARIGVSSAVAVCALLAVYAVQLAGAWLIVQGRAWGGRLIAAAGLAWFAGALLIHGPEIRAAGMAFRFGAPSVGGLILIVVVGALAMWYGLLAAQSAHRARVG